MFNRWQEKQHNTGSNRPDSGKADVHFRQLNDLLRANPRKKWLSYSIPVPEIDPLACIEGRSGEPDLYYWEKPDNQFAIAAGGAALTLKATGSNRFDDIGEQGRLLKKNHLAAATIQHSLIEPVLVGGYSFSEHNVQSMWKTFGAARFLMPKWSLIKSGKLHLLTITLSTDRKEPDEVIGELEKKISEFKTQCEAVRDNGSILSGAIPSRTQNGEDRYRLDQPRNAFTRWKEKVKKSKLMIDSGVFQKIVIARQLDFEAKSPIQVPLAMFQLRNRFPNCFNFMIKVNGGPVFMGATPERLISLKRSRVMTEGLAGSISRGESAIEDLALGRMLMESPKDRSEHNFVVEDIRNNLKPFSLRVDPRRQPVIKKLNNVQHLYTPISADIKKEITIHELAGALHPTPAVGGYPNPAAVPYINEIEEVDRGWYAGPVGWFSLSGSGEFAVAIRSAWIDRKSARLYAGAGIVKDSDPKTEWEETEMKLNPVLEALKLATRE